MSAQEQQQSAPPPRWRVFLWLAGVYAVAAVVIVVLTLVPLFLFGNNAARDLRNQQATATARAQQGGAFQSSNDAPAGDGSGPALIPTPDLRPTDTGFIPLKLPGVAAAPTQPPLPAPSPTPEAVPGGDSAATATLNDGDAAVVAPPTALPTFPPGSNPDMFANEATAAPAAPTQPPGPISGDSIHATASGSAPASSNKCNQQTTFEPGNAIDGKLDTAWRVEGDGASTGAFLMLDFGTDFTLTDVQIVPGYAKQDPCAAVYWFPLNRRVKQVRLDFSDGSTASGDLQDAATYQSIPFSPVRAKWVKITILDTYPAPSQAQGGRDYTPISDVKIIGTP